MYLIRETRKIAGGVVVSMFAGGRFFHYQFNRNGAGVYTNPQGKAIGTLPELVAYYKVRADAARAVGVGYGSATHVLFSFSRCCRQ